MSNQQYRKNMSFDSQNYQVIEYEDYFFTENIEKGDSILVSNVGAYCLTFSNRFPYVLPEILMINNKQIKSIFNPLSDHDFSIS